MEFPISGYSLERILHIVQRNNPTQAEILANNHVKEAILLDLNKNQWTASRIFRVQIFFEDQTVAPLTCVLKFPALGVKNNLENQGSDFRLTQDDATKMHDRECTFYEKFKDCEVLPKPQIWHAEKWNSTQKPGILIMEDLYFTTRAPLIYRSLSEKLVFDIVDNLAKFHAYQLDETKVWKGKFEDCAYLTTFDSTYLKSTLKKLLSIFPGVWFYFQTNLGKFDEQVCHLFKTISDNSFVDYAVRGCAKELGLPLVVCLGDLWSSNILKPKQYIGGAFSLAEEARALVDFQLSFEGNPLFDLAKLLSWCTDAEARKSLEERVLTTYLETLQKSISHHDAELFTTDKATLAYNYAFVHSSLGLAAALPTFYNILKDVNDRKWADANLEIMITRTQQVLEYSYNFLKEKDPKWI